VSKSEYNLAPDSLYPGKLTCRDSKWLPLA
jgi:hypothetical protein